MPQATRDEFAFQALALETAVMAEDEKAAICALARLVFAQMDRIADAAKRIAATLEAHD